MSQLQHSAASFQIRLPCMRLTALYLNLSQITPRRAVISRSASPCCRPPSNTKAPSAVSASFAKSFLPDCDPVSSSQVKRNVNSQGGSSPSSLRIQTPNRETRTPLLQSPAPSPQAQSPSIRNGCAAVIPAGKTVSRCADSSSFPCGLPSGRILAVTCVPSPGSVVSSTRAPSSASTGRSSAITCLFPAAFPVPLSTAHSASSSFSIRGSTALDARKIACSMLILQ